MIDAWFAAASEAHPQRALEVDHREAILALVAAGAGSTIVPASMAAGSDSAAVRVRPRPSGSSAPSGSCTATAPVAVGGPLRRARRRAVQLGSAIP